MASDGWRADPFGLHEERWISDEQPTSLVRDQGLETDDDPPERAPEPPARQSA